MEVYRFIIQGRLDGLNEYTRANRANAYKGNALKKKNERVVCMGIVEACMQGKLHKIDKYPIELKDDPVDGKFTWSFDLSGSQCEIGR